jgi:hypothetical protein
MISLSSSGSIELTWGGRAGIKLRLIGLRIFPGFPRGRPPNLANEEAMSKRKMTMIEMDRGCFRRLRVPKKNANAR